MARLVRPRAASLLAAGSAAPRRLLGSGAGGDRLAADARNAGGDGSTHLPLPPFVDESLRGVGQVVFSNSAGSGALMLAGLGVGDPYLAGLAAVGAATSTAAARLGGLDRAALSAGLYGYNGTLVGCAFSVFLGSSAPITLAATVAGAAAAPFVGRAITPLCGGAPPFTLAFNAITLPALALVRPFGAKMAAADPGAAIEAGAPPPAVEAALTGVMDLLLSPLTGVSQIFVVESPLSGALLLGAIGFYSPGCALATLCGSSVGAAVGAVQAAPAADIAAGLWGYNSALSALAVSVFFVPTPAAAALGLGSSAAAAGIFAASAPAFAATLATPCLTLPFCASAIAAHLAGNRLPGLILAPIPHSPERNGRAV